MSTVRRYAAGEMRSMAEYFSGTGTYATVRAMLRQAATDATRLQSLEAENARLRNLAEAMYESFVKGFTTTQSHGPSGEYKMVTTFHSLADMQLADKAWIDICLTGRENIARNALKED